MAERYEPKPVPIIFEYSGTPDSNPFAEGGTGVVLNVKLGDTVIGRLVLRPSGYTDGSGRKNAIEAYTASWGGAWRIQRGE